MPRPIAAGVFGMARTSAHGAVERAGKKLQRPSGHDRHDKRGRADHRRWRGHDLSGALRLYREDDGGSVGKSGAASARSCTPRSASAAICGDGCGSTTAMFAGLRPKRSQPSSRAPPISRHRPVQGGRTDRANRGSQRWKDLRRSSAYFPVIPDRRKAATPESITAVCAIAERRAHRRRL